MKNSESRLQGLICTVPFHVESVKDPNLIWNNKNYTSSELLKLAVVVKPNLFFQNIQSNELLITLKAEQYGGPGVGSHGGGARCGNIDQYQLKGIGVTPVLGYTNDLYHSSGTYPLYEAITETMTHLIYDIILPIGVIKSIGIIKIGESDYFVTPEKNGKKVKGNMSLAIGIREKSVRVGHFLRAGFYKPIEKYESIVKPDVERVREINTQLAQRMTQTQFIKLVGTFLFNCANQFAYARVFRVAHGAITPSNISIDGKWLDLTNTTFVPGDYNYKAGSGDCSFLDEKEEVVKIVTEWIYTYAKYNFTQLDIAPLIKYFNEQYDAYFSYYVVEIIGLSSSNVAQLKLDDEVAILAKFYAELLQNSSKILKGVPVSQPVDNEHTRFIESLLVNDGEHSIPSELSEAVESIFQQMFLSERDKFKRINSFKNACLIKAFRKLYYTPFFYIGRIYLYARKIVGEENIDLKIEEVRQVTYWVFDNCDNHEQVFIFKSKNLSISFSPTSDFYFLCFNDNSQNLNKTELVKFLEKTIRK